MIPVLLTGHHAGEVPTPEMQLSERTLIAGIVQRHCCRKAHTLRVVGSVVETPFGEAYFSGVPASADDTHGGGFGTVIIM